MRKRETGEIIRLFDRKTLVNHDGTEGDTNIDVIRSEIGEYVPAGADWNYYEPEAIDLVERRQALHAELGAHGPRPANRQVKLQAMSQLFDRINPPPAQEVTAAQDQETVLNIARRLRAKGDDEGAKRVMIQAQVDPTLLGDRNAPPDFQERVDGAVSMYKSRRIEALKDLQRQNYGWTD